jgi:hypothetical protein
MYIRDIWCYSYWPINGWDVDNFNTAPLNMQVSDLGLSGGMGFEADLTYRGGRVCTGGEERTAPCQPLPLCAGVLE